MIGTAAGHPRLVAGALSSEYVLKESVSIVEAWRSLCVEHGYVEQERVPLVSSHDPSIRFTNSTISVLKPLLYPSTTGRHFLVQPAIRLRNFSHFRRTGQMSPFGCSFMSFGLLAPPSALDEVCHMGAQFIRSLPATHSATTEYRLWPADTDILEAASRSGLPVVEDTVAERPYRHVFGIDGVGGRNTNLHVGGPAVANVIVIERGDEPVAIELAFGINMILVGSGAVSHPVLATPASAAAMEKGIDALIALDTLHTCTMLAMEGMVPAARGRSGNYRQLLKILSEQTDGALLAEASHASAEMEAALRMTASPPCGAMVEHSPAETARRLCEHLGAVRLNSSIISANMSKAARAATGRKSRKVTSILVDGWKVSERRFLDILDEPRTQLLVSLQDLVTRATTEFWSERGLRNVHLPITTGAVSSPMGLGSDSKPVKVSLFGVETYLADSMQFMLEYACRVSPAGAWYLMPSFRGEATDKTHLAQFFHSEAEIPGTLDDVMEVAEAYVRSLTAAVLTECGDDIASLVGGTGHLDAMVSANPFRRMTFDEAAAYLEGDSDAIHADPGGWRTLTRHGEQRLLAEVSPFLWVTHYDHLSVPFYQAYSDDSRRAACNADLLFGIGEVIGSGERHTTGDGVLDALKLHEVEPKQYRWYIDMKSERPMRTAGFGLGVERWLMWVLGASDIREMQLVPRANGTMLVP